MNANELLLNAKAGLVNVKPARMISNKGSIGDIRKRTKAMLRPPGFPKYGMLGSQNAMSSEAPKENKIEIDIEITDENPPIEPKPVEPVEPKPIEPTPEPKEPLIGGKGGKQSEKSKEEMEQRKRDEAKAPASKPPYDLSTKVGQDDLKAYIEYIKLRYSNKETIRDKIEELEKDSAGFTMAIKTYRQINKQISAFNKDQANTWKQWANNILVEFGDDIIDALQKGAMKVAPQMKVAIEGIKKILQHFKPTEMKDFVNSMKQIQDKLFEGKPEWKERLNIEMKHAFDDWWNKWKNFPGMSDDTDIPEGVDKSKIPFSGLF